MAMIIAQHYSVTTYIQLSTQSVNICKHYKGKQFFERLNTSPHLESVSHKMI